MPNNKNQPRFAFLLGAGASFEAGLPTLTILTEKFAKHLETTNKYLFQSLKDILNGKDFSDALKLPDVETLLGHLERIIDLRHHLLCRRFCGGSASQSQHQYGALGGCAANVCGAGTALSVTEVCYTVGFASLGSFSWLFKRRFGISPEAYRQRKMQKATSQER